ncbi:MAG: hypothetical protein ABEJ89_07880 [Haloarculaceae archaeon]
MTPRRSARAASPSTRSFRERCTMQIDAETIRECRERDGAAKSDRRAEIDDRLAPEEELGYGEGLPLVGDDYADYPSEPSELALPEWREFIHELASSRFVGGYDDMVEELTPSSSTPTLREWLEAVERACDLFDVDTSEAFEGDGNAESDESDGDDDLDLVTTTVPSDLANDAETNPLVVGHLYALGLSVEEIAEFVRQELGRDTAVDSRQVRDTLKAVGLLEGRTRDERERERRRRGPEADEVNRHRATTVDVSKNEPEDYEGGNIVVNDVT